MSQSALLEGLINLISSLCHNTSWRLALMANHIEMWSHRCIQEIHDVFQDIQLIQFSINHQTLYKNTSTARTLTTSRLLRFWSMCQNRGQWDPIFCYLLLVVLVDNIVEHWKYNYNWRSYNSNAIQNHLQLFSEPKGRFQFSFASNGWLYFSRPDFAQSQCI